MSNEIAKTQPKKVTFTQFVQTETIQNAINKALTDPKRAMSFMASIMSAISVNPVLKNECDPHSVLSVALLGEALGLSPSPQLGQFYMVPFDDKKSGLKKAQFILGFKGYLALAVRSGQFKHITAIEIKEGELRSFDPMHDKIECIVITDPIKRELAKTIGYYGYFELLNGFEKAIYLPLGAMERHADTYSKAFSLKTYRLLQAGKIDKEELWKYSSFWYKSFDVMAKKTILRMMLSSGYAPLSVEMMRAVEADDKLVDAHEDGTEELIDVENDIKDIPEAEDPFTKIEQDAKEPEISDANEDFGDQLNLTEI
jgi:recombination protein RecT